MPVTLRARRASKLTRLSASGPRPPTLQLSYPQPAPASPGGPQGRALTDADCQNCGACCAYSSAWPRFSTEDEADLALLPPSLVSADLAGMACNGSRCAALSGDVGRATSCAVYAIRPVVCRECEPGGDDCLMARRAYGL